MWLVAVGLDTIDLKNSEPSSIRVIFRHSHPDGNRRLPVLKVNMSLLEIATWPV
jgi:hypothetical protein